MTCHYVGLKWRVFAFALDYLVILVYLGLLTLGSFLSGQWLFHRLAPLLADPALLDLFAFVSVIVPVGLYYAVAESSAWQGTWGKRRMRLRVGSKSGSRISFSKSLLRSFVKFIPWQLAHSCIFRFLDDPAGPRASAFLGGMIAAQLVAVVYGVIIAINPNHQSVYDWIAGTFVVWEQYGTVPGHNDGIR